MNSKLSKQDILQMLNRSHPSSHIGAQARCFGGETPSAVLGRYIVAAVHDLYGETSSDEANLQRISHGLELGSALLERVAGRLRKGVH